MKLWTLLAKARVVSSGDGELVLGFGEESAFQMEALQSSPGPEEVAGLWERFVGQPVKVKLVLVAPRVPKVEAEPAVAAPEDARVAPPAPVEDPAPEPIEDPTEVDRIDAADVALQSEGAEQSGQKSSAEIARIFKERFDGEIIEKDKEGKD
jgi:hypothetical protein